MLSASWTYTDPTLCAPPSTKVTDSTLCCGGLDSLAAESLIDSLGYRPNPCFHCIQEDFRPLDTNKGEER